MTFKFFLALCCFFQHTALMGAIHNYSLNLYLVTALWQDRLDL